METIMHLKDVNMEYFKNYTALGLNKLLSWNIFVSISFFKKEWYTYIFL
jgi:hypothetical protein